MAMKEFDPVNFAMMVAYAKAKGGGGGGSAQLDALIDRSIENVQSDAESIGDYAFAYCTSLKTVNFPKAESIGASAFSSSSLETAIFSKVDALNNKAFSGCYSLKSVTFSEITSIQGGSNTRTALFYQISELKDVFFPKVTSIGKYCIVNCGIENITDDNFPEALSIGDYGLYGNFWLESVIFPKVNSIGANAFASCEVLETVVLRASTVCELANISAFSNTPFASGKSGGTLYVPQALISEYQSASNWSTILGYPNNQILPIEGSPYEEE